jgi:hypothetical protein
LRFAGGAVDVRFARISWQRFSRASNRKQDLMRIRTALRWYQLACVITMVTGVICALASHPATEDVWLYLFDMLKWPLDGDPATFSADTRAVNAVLGGTMVGWGLLMYLLAHHITMIVGLPRILLMALVAWFVVDSTGSIMADLPGNVLLNSIFLGLFVPPLLVLQRASARA